MQPKIPEQHDSKSLRALLTSILTTFKHPTLKTDLTVLKPIHKCALLDDVLHIELILPFAWLSGFESLKRCVSHELRCVTRATSINWQLKHNIATLKSANGLPSIKGVRNIIAVSSGKGGVGKSSIAVNLALALVAEGANVGLLDADIYGPSIPTMLGTTREHITSLDGQYMIPIKVHDLLTHSIGYLANNDRAIVWRGPMASKALIQLLQNTLWLDLDYLVLDMPPGTGDIQLTLSKAIPVTCVIMVTTPQDIALIDVSKSITMFERIGVPILGVIENMSMYICSHCGYHESIFGDRGGEKLAKKYRICLLGKIPLHLSLREDLDRGAPTVVSRPNSRFTMLYRQIAGDVAALLYWKGKVIP
ncbi:iron-sulfur cluster carrier protein ApbC [Candidatus Gillettellia adelgis]